MCQLSLISLRNEEINRIFLLNQLIINASSGNTDGTGIITCLNNPEIWKTNLSASLITNLGNIIKDVVRGKNAVAGHVRKATPFLGEKIISNEKAHPFETENLILMHNGSLFPENPEENKNLIDSEVFLKRLDYFYSGDIVKDLNSAMSEFTGKFAFIIFDKNLREFFVVRGDSSSLFCYAKDGLLLVNTERLSLVESMMLSSNHAQLLRFDHDFSSRDIKELERETIYKLDRKSNILEKIGKLKENKPKVIPASQSIPYSRASSNNTIDSSTFSSSILEFIFDLDISVEYLDRIFYLLYDRGLLDSQEFELQDFIGTIMPEISIRATKSKKKEWRMIKRLAGMNELNIHTKYLIKFPYFMEEVGRLRKLRGQIKNEKRA